MWYDQANVLITNHGLLSCRWAPLPEPPDNWVCCGLLLNPVQTTRMIVSHRELRENRVNLNLTY